MFEQSRRGTMAVRIGATVVAVGLLVLTAAGAGAAVGGDDVAPNHSADSTSPVRIYDHETVDGETLHTIELAPATVDPSSDDVLGVVVLPERDRICQSVAGDGAGCMEDGSTVESYLDAAGVERDESGEYVV
ncbi:hypothetical protein [Haloplanus salinarum]|uniref:hypothetical protein n=1 Tax=Haloplanus salinarum TaxID=1912324 RepID=UPI00214C1C2B|nr:hypothetical protein [Haloplanus salinarum]